LLITFPFIAEDELTISIRIHNENSRIQLDIWESVLNLTGWNWQSMSTAFRQSETMYAPPPNTADVLPYDAELHGGAGPIESVFQRSVYSLYSEFVSPTLEAAGFTPTHDGNDGDANGPNFLPLAIYPFNYTRSYAGSAYTTVEYRPNLEVRTNCQVTGITWASTTNGSATASGLQYVAADGSSNQTTAVSGAEVIISAGTIQSPQILELSGIGDASILRSVDITPIVSLPAVGTSLRDPPMTNYYPIQFQISDSANLTGNEYIQNFIDLEPASRILSPEDYLAASTWLNSTTSIPGLGAAQLSVFKELWYRDQPLIEFAWQYQTANVTPYCLVPLSQGTIHVNSSDPLHPPAINPNYNTVNATINGEEVQWDMWFLAKAAQYYTTLLATSSPMNSIVTATVPDYTLPFEQWYAAIFRQTGSSQHLTGGNPMLERAAGGVVDTELRVYGTRNVRVVDGSVFPYQPSAHPMGVTYALAVRAAGIFQKGRETETTGLLGGNVSANATARFPGGASGGGNGTAVGTGAPPAYTGRASVIGVEKGGWGVFAVLMVVVYLAL
jgi:choline dehydrogenase